MPSQLRKYIDAAAGRTQPDLVLKGGRIVNVLSHEVHEGDVAIVGERIVGIGDYDGLENVDLGGRCICPGFIDGHIHIESSMLGVDEFARLVSARGTTAVVADPHEIANVLGAEGVRFILSSSKHCPIHVFITASSCVPASRFETAGGELDALDLSPLFHDKWVIGLAEMMNYPGVVAGDDDCLEKLAMASGRVIDGHAPGLRGRDLCAYTAAGIMSDHECTTLEEAQEKLRMGMHIMIREGSQARNLDALLPLITPETADRIMFVTDDRDVDDLLEHGHMDHILRLAVAGGVDPITAVRLVTINTARYFRLHHLGAVAPGRAASLTIVDDLESFKVNRVYQAGRLVAHEGRSCDTPDVKKKTISVRSSVNVQWLEPEQFAIPAPEGTDGSQCSIHVIEVSEGRIDTTHSVEDVQVTGNRLQTHPDRDLAKLAVIERHQASGNIGFGFVRGFGLKAGALASTVGHDSHNLLVVGTNDHDMYSAAVHLVKIRGGFCVVRDGRVLADVPLPIAGLMSDQPADILSKQLQDLHRAAHSLDCTLRRPLMALAFLSLSVIGEMKVTDQGLVDVTQFKLIDLHVKK
ncbi:MAG: adenine deaminase [Planctomycetes bacterium]|nr:adenine deaminase [Planctomycetota bacterium]NOG53042.1 adenine deaminase [Planctomycetota bacterium]